jgi:hypothetical protein
MIMKGHFLWKVRTGLFDEQVPAGVMYDKKKQGKA